MDEKLSKLIKLIPDKYEIQSSMSWLQIECLFSGHA